MIRVLIVEDDPMVAQLNKQFIEKVEGYDLVDITHNVKRRYFSHRNSTHRLSIIRCLYARRKRSNIINLYKRTSL
ncbi:DNA-binding transcriptional activator DcuR [Staphylococcus gallinarum]|uniref:DNA-binding transcriptional activator DcuR n=1 Tax=Staphylococcus gallinarum TaxID=1293 RepID=A0A380FA03_STAGA|nr:DNA-binding transcriptional activator DcuR [Staphylococcus gallinarum]